MLEGIGPGSPAMQADSLPSEPPGKLLGAINSYGKKKREREREKEHVWGENNEFWIFGL